jgi:hypothetical protein
MADRMVYIVTHKKKYKTNKTNATRLWEVFECEWGKQELEILYKADEEDICYTNVPARVHRIKKISQDSIDNKFKIQPVSRNGQVEEDHMTVIFDVLGGRD